MSDRTQRIKGAANEAAGKTRGSIGHETGRKRTTAKGAAQVAKGKAQKAVGKARTRAKRAAS